jgi:RNA polymerase sigma factor (sigma-70 family)
LKSVESGIVLEYGRFPMDNEKIAVEKLTEILKKYNPLLNAFLSKRLDSREDVNDIVQEIFIRVHRTLRHEELRYPRAFIFRSACNLVKDRIRANKARASECHVPIEEVHLSSTQPTVQQIMESKELLKLIEGILAKLKPETRRAFVMSRVKGFTYERIASEMGISESMVKHHIRAVLGKCREAIVMNL